MRTLSAKLLLTLGGLVVVMSLFHVVLTVQTTRSHLSESMQRQNRDLAANIASEAMLLKDNKIDDVALAQIFHSLMVINPSIKLYLLDPEGYIRNFAATPGKLLTRRVALTPIRQLLDGKSDLPIRGDDPRSASGRQIFSVAPLVDRGELRGYLYVILGSDSRSTVASLLETSYILRLSLGVAALGLLVALVAAYFFIRHITRPLSLLAAGMGRFDPRSAQPTALLPAFDDRVGGDDVAELRRSFEALTARVQHQFRQLSDVDANRRDMIAAISHDLRTPLAALRGQLDTLRIKQENFDNEARQSHLNLAVRQCERLSALIDDLFELAKLEAPDAAPDLENFALAELVQDVAQKLSPVAAQRQIALEFDQPDATKLVRADIGLIERVLENLLENALKYSADGGCVRIQVVHCEIGVSTAVSDSGPGIPAVDLPHVFERFYRVDKVRGGGAEGTGLGLAIARQIMLLHGSDIEVESVFGEGATFRFALASGDT